jgi:hypothetical protein
VFLLAALFAGFLFCCHGSILPSILHGLCNDALLQLFDCIESTKSDVKQKMTRAGAHDPCTKVTVGNSPKIFSSKSIANRIRIAKNREACSITARERSSEALLLSSGLRQVEFQAYGAASIYN